MSELSPQLLDAIDRLLDGAMTPSEQAAFQRQVDASPDLRAALEQAQRLQRDVDASLRAQFSAAALDLNTRKPASKLAPGVTTHASPTHARPLRFPKWVALAVAACVGLVAVLGVYVYSTGAARVGPAVRPTLTALYNSAVDSGFKPEEVCTTRDKFAEWLGLKFGTSLAVRDERSDVTLVGWSYSTAISPYTGVLLARSGDQPIIVALDLKVRESGRCPPAVGDLLAHNSKLHVHRAVIEGLSFYEISPFEQPRIIDNLELYKPGN